MQQILKNPKQILNNSKNAIQMRHAIKSSIFYCAIPQIESFFKNCNKFFKKAKFTLLFPFGKILKREKLIKGEEI